MCRKYWSDLNLCQNLPNFQENLKTATLAGFVSIHPPLDPFPRSYNWYQSIGFHCFGFITVGGRWMCLRWGVLDVECLFSMGSIITFGRLKCLISLMNFT